MIRDLGRRVAIAIILSGIILGGMSISLANMPSSPAGETVKLNHP
ncbi:protein YkpC [Bacillus atrophaeus]|nr:protein YkpC [Bacillus atrophaeus]MCY8917042.1 protein YkpC [Bacillus atrophaeus]MCY8925327.1 protein YkpC [Bacillus atrophaeus]MED4859263.1 protein YkpC [Bacillus atrophaeus]